MSGIFTLGMEERGSKSMIVADINLPLGQSSCVGCGSCVQVCPTGAIIDRQSAYLGHDKHLTVTRSVCRGCSLGCGILVHIRDNHIVKITGDWDADNAGVLCKTGRFLAFQQDQTRITTPLKRVAGKLTPTSWEDALVTLNQNLKPLNGEIAALASTRLSIEVLYAFKSLFADGLKSDMVTSIEEGRTTGLQSRYAEENSSPIEAKLSTLRTADCILLVGADLTVAHEVAGFYIRRNLPKGVRLIVVDADENGMAELANIKLTPKPGTDEAVFKALEAVILKDGLGRVKSTSKKPALKTALKVCGLSEEDVTKAAYVLAEAVAPVIVYGKGISASSESSVVEAMVRVAKLIGASDAERRGIFSVKGKANSLAAALLHLESPLEVNGHKAAYIVLGDDRASQPLLEKLVNIPYLVVQASYESELTERADLVLPGAIWAEEGGHTLNAEGRLQFANCVVNASVEVCPNLSILNDVARALDVNINNDWRAALTQRTSPVELELEEAK
jgi:formate dehydrogenase major subunit